MYGAGFGLNIRTLGLRFFHRFGLHCATHQIRVILISAVVITSLFYPALALYSSSQPQFLAQFSSRLLDSFLVTETLASYHAFHDLRDVWAGYDPLRIREDSAARARCGTDRILRVERVLIHSALPEDTGAVNNQILLSTLKLERQIGDLLSSKNMPCLRKVDGTCFVSSPIAFWDYDEAKLSSDTNIFDTLQFSSNVTVSNVPITLQMVLAGRGASDSSLDFAMFLVLTYIFRETDCLGNTGHSAWLRILEQAADARDVLITLRKEPRLIALEHKGTTRSYYSVLSTFTYLAYISLLVYGYELSRRTDKVHSKIGVVFTGSVELLVSTITSLSVCALAGFKITMIPWEIFPILVVFVGIENMFSLVDAVYKTSVALPVKERIAEGLSRAGTSNTLKLVSYNTILGTLAFFSFGAIRQFCAFAIVVLVAHWFLVHTFFVTVLSIDLQRLELNELLQQGTNLASSIPKDPAPPQASTRWRKAALLIRSLLRGRANKNLTLVLLLATTGVLYYSTQPSFIRSGDHTRSQPIRGAISRDKPSFLTSELQSPPSQIWHLLNPNDDPLVHLRLEAPTIVVFRPHTNDSQALTDFKLYHRSRFSIRTSIGLAWVLKIVLGPILATTGILYVLLLYLLKDAQLLEAQYNRVERDAPKLPSVEPPIDDQISFFTLPRTCSTDVEMLAASKDGQIVATIGTDGEFVIWRIAKDNQTYASIDVTDTVERGAASSSEVFGLTALAVDDDGRFCAVGVTTGVIAVWNIDKGHVKPLHRISLDDSSSSVVDLIFITSPNLDTVEGPASSTSLLATYRNGTAATWTIEGSSADQPILLYPSRSPFSSYRSSIVSIPTNHRHMVAFLLEDGTLELCDVSSSTRSILNFCVPVGIPTDPISLVHAYAIEINGIRHTIIGVATRAGVVSVWDRDTCECITVLDDVYGEVNNLRLSGTKSKSCSFCGEMTPDAFIISFSVEQIVLVYKAYVMISITRKCSCPGSQPQQVPFKTAGIPSKRSSRQGSLASPGTSSPLYSRSRHHSLSGGTTSIYTPPSFPVSGHGVHSRRTNEKDTLRKAVESMVLPVLTLENEEISPSHGSSLDVPTNASIPPSMSRSQLWENVIVVRTADTTFERGKWAVVNDKIVGIRRRPRQASKTRHSMMPRAQLEPEASASGLTLASLNRWELWMLDPLAPKVQASTLVTLQRDQIMFSASLDASQSRNSQSQSIKKNYNQSDIVSRLPFTRVSLFMCGPSYCFAGFGNTIGVFKFSGAAPSAIKKLTEQHLRDRS